MNIGNLGYRILDFKSVARYLSFSVIVIVLFQFPEILGSLSKNYIHFQTLRINPREISTGPLKLPAGRYYVSYGIVRGACDAKVNNNIVDSNKSQGNGVRSKILLGHEFTVNNGDIILLSLKCDFQEGFTASLANDPLVLQAWAGKFIQTYRTFTSVGLGLGSTFFLFMVAFFVLIVRRKLPATSGCLDFLIFSATGVFSLVSYCQLPRLWLDGPTATLLHIIFRNWFAMGSLLILSTYLGKWRRLAFGFLPLSFVYFLFDFKARSFWPYYKNNYILFAVVTSIFCYELFKKRDHSKEMQLIRMISICWACALWMDVHSMFTNTTNYNTPIVMALTCTVFVYLIIYDRFKLEHLDIGIKRILSIAQSEKKPEIILAEISDLLFEYTKFTRISCYIDAFLLGENSIPNVRMLRVFEKGYRKDTSKDYKIDFTSNQGTKMRVALESQLTSRGKGADGGYFVIIPIGKYIVINLSNDEPATEYQLQLSFEMLDRMKHGLKSIERKMNEMGTTGGNLLQKLRSYKRETSFQCETIGIMLDIHDYSKNCQRYKVDESNSPFAKFVSTQFLPGLARSVSGLAYPESLEGDLIAFVILRDTFDTEAEYLNSVSQVLHKLSLYKETAGQEAAMANGFEKIQFSVAAGSGMATVTLDEYKARTSGDALTIARRILDSAPRESIMISKEVVVKFSLQKWKVKSERAILVKKDLVEACLIESVSERTDAA